MSVLLAACIVLAVHDGDTLTVECTARKNPLVIRVAEIDAPEMPAFTWGEQPGARAAGGAATALCLGKDAKVRLNVYDKRTARWVAHVECHGTDLSSYLASQGLVWPYLTMKNSDIPALVRAAQDLRVGLWSEGQTPIPPSQWRKGCKCQ